MAGNVCSLCKCKHDRYSDAYRCCRIVERFGKRLPLECWHCKCAVDLGRVGSIKVVQWNLEEHGPWPNGNTQSVNEAAGDCGPPLIHKAGSRPGAYSRQLLDLPKERRSRPLAVSDDASRRTDGAESTQGSSVESNPANMK